MTNEAIKVELYGNNGDGQPRWITCGATQEFKKNTTILLIEPRTAASFAIGGLARPAAGICAMDKDSTDGSTRMTVWTDGIWDMICSGAVTVGEPVEFQNNNQVGATSPNASGAVIAGYALETGSNGERIQVRIRL